MRKHTLLQRGFTGVVWSALKGVCLSALLGIGLSPATAAAQNNPIVIENQQPGTSQWQISGVRATDTEGQIKGYASAPSVNKGENITFYVSVNPAQTYTIAVRDDSRTAALLYQQPVTTYQAYNDYPYDNATGKSLYAFNSFGATTVTGGKNAAKVSFDRPYHGDGTGRDWGQSVFSWEISFIRWIEQAGYDVTY